MAPTTDVAVEKAVREREASTTTIKWLEDNHTNHSTKPISLLKVDKFLTTVAIHQQKIEEQYNRIMALVDPADRDPHTQEYLNLMDRLLELEEQFTIIKNALNPPTTSTSSSTAHSAEVRLPRLDLPTFNGSLSQWISFRDIFVASIHNKTTLSNAQKLTYLKSLLKDEASRLIQTLSITDDNYDIAWNKLTSRYQNERELVFSIFQRLVSLQSIQQLSAAVVRHLIDEVEECIRSLNIFSLPIDKTMDAFLVFSVSAKLDPHTKNLWGQSLVDKTVPTLSSLLEFLEKRAEGLFVSSNKASTQGHASSNHHQHHDKVRRTNQVHHTHSAPRCKLCSSHEIHPAYKCQAFMSKSVAERIQKVKQLNLCLNCLREGHQARECSSKSNCWKCSSRHHTTLHTEGQQKESQPSSTLSLHQKSNPVVSKYSGYQTIFATALIQVSDEVKSSILSRAFLDNGSGDCYVTESFVRKHHLKKIKTNATIEGLGSHSVGSTTAKTRLFLSPHFDSSVKVMISAYVIPSITRKIPITTCDPRMWPHLKGLKLADPYYFKSADVDILIGGDCFFELIRDGRCVGPPGTPSAINSVFGWLVSGKSQAPATNLQVHHVLSLEEQVQKFWEIEDLPVTPLLTKEEERIENHFIATTTRDERGRFIVQLPFKDPRPTIGDSFTRAQQRFLQLERKLNSTGSHFKQDYIAFMREFQELGHMEKVPREEVDNPRNPIYFIPHHCVMKDSSTTTKLRVVFDASAKSTSGFSLNDCLMIGPTIQPSLISILTRFRIHPIAITADIAKMYRQVRMNSNDADMQRILWREDPKQPIQQYRLLTVTYGTASAPFQATRTLQQLAHIYEKEYPVEAEIVRNDFYVDDLMSGGSDPSSTITIAKNLKDLIKLGGMDLRKWVCNNAEVLKSINEEELIHNRTPFSIVTDESVKTLGISWNPVKDTFEFKISLEVNEKPYTKRLILSEMAKIFDPMGWLAPVIIKGKIFIQRLWQVKLGWDAILPIDIQQEWLEYRNTLCKIELIALPRCIIPFVSFSLSLVGFSDASTKAYSAVIYLCAHAEGHPTTVSLVTSKTRVAPLKTISIPRLELCAALLLSQLMDNVLQTLKQPIDNVTAWTDSSITLHWIQNEPNRWKTFVANRVSKIQKHVHPSKWGFVPGEENPADCASRGLYANELSNFSLWWTGPSWLKEYPSRLPSGSLIAPPSDASTEEKEQKHLVHHIVSQDFDLIRRYSRLSTLTRVAAYMLRFINNARKDIKSGGEKGPAGDVFGVSSLTSRECGLETRPSKTLTATELDSALMCLIRLVQHQDFAAEMKCLANKQQLHYKSKLLGLCPFVDSCGVLRVGGRLARANISSDQRNPILLPRHNQLTDLIIRSIHEETLHGGPQLTLSTIAQRFWIIRGRDAVRFHLKKCVKCTRLAAKVQQQLMGDLPLTRVNPSRPFLKCGVDYAGPFQIKPNLKRCKVTLKAYLAIFVCFSTRAIHLEIVSDLTTDAFLASFRRFISRRGRPADVFSDNGTNFEGAANQIKECSTMLSTLDNQGTIETSLASMGINWHFIPPSAPHFGGLWEAGVKSVKYHLKRLISVHRLTFEELTTITTQIEACLNSRPLTALSSDPNDLSFLTPGHFLIGAPLNSMPEPDLTTINMGKLDRWQLVQQVTQHFWRRWSGEFLTRLQQRPKWTKLRRNMMLDDLVIIKDERFPPQQWKLGRVIQLHKGIDDQVRVVTLKTSSGEIKRPIVKLCLLPLSE